MLYYSVFCEYYKNGERKIAIIPSEKQPRRIKTRKENPICYAYEFWFASNAVARVIKTNIEKYFLSVPEIDNYYYNFTRRNYLKTNKNRRQAINRKKCGREVFSSLTN